MKKNNKFKEYYKFLLIIIFSVILNIFWNYFFKYFKDNYEKNLNNLKNFWYDWYLIIIVLVIILSIWLFYKENREFLKRKVSNFVYIFVVSFVSWILWNLFTDNYDFDLSMFFIWIIMTSLILILFFQYIFSLFDFINDSDNSL